MSDKDLPTAKFEEAVVERNYLLILTSQIDYALRLLVSLKDGPRDAAYEEDKVLAWKLAREAVAAVDKFRSSP